MIVCSASSSSKQQNLSRVNVLQKGNPLSLDRTMVRRTWLHNGTRQKCVNLSNFVITDSKMHVLVRLQAHVHAAN
jgi:hypothetical protein